MQGLCQTHNRWQSCPCARPKPGHVIGPSHWGRDEFTYLPGMGMISVGPRLLPVPRSDLAKGVHYWEALIVGRWDNYRVVDRKIRVDDMGGYHMEIWFQWLHATYTIGQCHVWRTGGSQALWVPQLRKWCSIMPRLLQIQRAARAFLARRLRLREARVVFAMGMVSPGCVVASLPPEMVARVCAWVV